MAERITEVTGIGWSDTDPNLFDQLGLRDWITAHYNADTAIQKLC